MLGSHLPRSVGEPPRRIGQNGAETSVAKVPCQFVVDAHPASPTSRARPSQASRSLPSINHAVAWVTPNSLDNCVEEMPLRAIAEKIDCVEPLVKGNVRPLEDRASTNRKLVLAMAAPIITEALPFTSRYSIIAASWAVDLATPPVNFEKLAGGFRVGEHLKRSNHGDGEASSFAMSVARWTR